MNAVKSAAFISLLSSPGTIMTRGTAFVPSQESHQQTFRLARISLLAAAIGVAAGGLAYLLYNLIILSSNLFFFGRWSFTFVSPQHNTLGMWVVGITVLGGLIVGLMSKYGSSKIRGHGIPEAMEAVMTGRSRIEPRVAILKPLSAAIAIGAGGPFGAEGPIIQTGGAIGSMIGQAMRSTASERKVLLACGAAAGMSATFGTPLAAVILAIELLLFEFKSRSFIPLVIASTLAAAVRSVIMDGGPMFALGAMRFDIVGGLPYYIVLGLVCGVTAVAITKLLYRVEDVFELLPIDRMWWPAIGALGLGVIGFYVPRVFGIGYDTIGDILNERLPLEILGVLILAKAAVLVFSLGSGTSGGLLAPTFMVSAALGAALAMVINMIIPGAHVSPGAFALVAMGAVFGAASRSTFAFIVFAFELTRDYNAVLPLMLVGVIADGVGLMFLKNSIMTEKLARRGLTVPSDYEADAFQHVRVRQIMNEDLPLIDGNASVGSAAGRMASLEETAERELFIIVDRNGQLRGIVTRGDILAALEAGLQNEPVISVGTKNVVTASPDDTVHKTLNTMMQYHLTHMPVMSPEHPDRAIGYVGTGEILQARRAYFESEHRLEDGWFT